MCTIAWTTSRMSGHPEKRARIQQTRLQHIQRRKSRNEAEYVHNGQGSPVHVAECSRGVVPPWIFVPIDPKRGFDAGTLSGENLRGPDRFSSPKPAVTDYDTLHLSADTRDPRTYYGRVCRRPLARIGIWRILSNTPRLLWTPLPAYAKPGEAMDADP